MDKFPRIICCLSYIMIQILPNVEILRKNLFKMLDKQFFCVYNI